MNGLLMYVEQLIFFFKSGAYKKANAAKYIVRNYLNYDRSEYSDAWIMRMAKNVPGLHFEGKIHETLTPTSGVMVPVGAIVEHFGYIFSSEEKRMEHFRRNEPLIKEMLEKEPDATRWKISLVQEYRAISDFDSLIQYGKRFLDESKGIDEKIKNRALGTYYASIILGYIGKDEYSNALEVCKTALEDRRNNEITRTFLYSKLAYIYFFIGEYDESIQYGNEFLKMEEFFKKEELLLFEQKTVMFTSEVFDVQRRKELLSLIMCSGLMKCDISYFQKYFPELHWEENVVYVFEKFMGCFLYAISNMEHCPFFDEVIQVILNNSALWNHFEEEMIFFKNAGNPHIEKIEYAVSRVLNPEETKMLDEIKKQIDILRKNGLDDEAEKVVSQVKVMAPWYIAIG